ncbi:MAG: GyrI-like domain-containing protein [Pseudobdellovibrionaceae bacterium]
MRVILGMIAGTIAVIALGLALYLGAFKSVEMEKVEHGPMNFLLIEKMGPYHKVSETIAKAEAWAKKNNIPCKITFGEYLDDPNKLEADRLRANVGCLIEDADKEAALSSLSTSPQTESGEALKFETRPQQTYVKALFRGSPGIGPLKVYPKASNFMEDKGLQLSGPVIETYEITSPSDMTTVYFFPVR